jgi:hypothetical protein
MCIDGSIKNSTVYNTVIYIDSRTSTLDRG